MSIQLYLQKAAEKAGFRREYFLEKNMPTSSSSVQVVFFFGDLRSTFILSSLLLRQYKESQRGKYIILVSWPEFRELFPYVDEFWSPQDESLVKLLATGADNFDNHSEYDVQLRRNLFEVLPEVVSYKELREYYDNGFTAKYWDCFKQVKRFLPTIPAVNQIREDFKRQITNQPGPKAIFYPSIRVRTWQQGRNILVKVPSDPWKALIERVIREGITPVIYQNQFTYDLSTEFGERCIYLVTPRMIDTLTAMNYVGCTVDMFSGISRIALAARCPFLVVDERTRFIKQKDFEIDDLGGLEVPKHYVFSFSTLLLTGSSSEWDTSLFDAVVAGLKKLLTKTPNNGSIGTNEVYEAMDYSRVREHRAKRLGAAFIRRRY